MNLRNVSALNRTIRKIRRFVLPLDSFLRNVPGVVHIGANTGQEREQYASLGLNVLWVEPIPSIFEELQSNISKYTNQRACRALLAEDSGKEYTLHVASNGGASSSILDLGLHKEVWPSVQYTHDIVIQATTLSELLASEVRRRDDYGALVLDTQGSELSVLKGGIRVLSSFEYIKIEVADFDSYVGCCQFDELHAFMRTVDFKLHRRVPVATLNGVGNYYDAVYRRR